MKFCECKGLKIYSNTLWVGRQESVGPAPPFFASGGPQTGVWSTKTKKDLRYFHF